MMSFYKLLTVAHYEMRTLLRSWFFRIFAGLSVVGLGIFNIAVNIADSGAPFIYRALPASLPYVNLLVLNLGQAIVAVFLASEFLKQDRKNDTVEVIYARSMTNAEYILGKALGVLSVFFILNLVILAMGIGFSFLSGDSSKGILEYLYYPIFISLPTLVYILGLSFFLMILLKNQAITFIILLGYIALSLFYLDTKLYHLFDYIAYQVPMMNSTIGGFGNLHEVLIHRGIFFFIGMGLVFFTVFKLDRLPQSKKFTSFPIYLTVLSLLAGAYLIKNYIHLKQGNIAYKKELIAGNNTYFDYPRASVDSCDIQLEHHGEQIIVSARLHLINNNPSPIDTLIFTLNPDLILSAVEWEGEAIPFIQSLQIVQLIPPGGMPAATQSGAVFHYQGNINENTYFLDQNLDEYDDNFSFEIFRLRKRYAYLKPDFVCFTRGALWYPISGVGYASEHPTVYAPDFTQFTLSVKTLPGLRAISQGEMTQVDPGTYNFKPEAALPEISLLVGDYIQHSITVDSIDYSIFTIDGNQYYEEYFTDFGDSLPGLIRGLKVEYESMIGMSYPFKRWSLAEVPIQFSLDKHIWSISSDAVQPEITFYTEKGVVLEEADFKKRKDREKTRMKRDKEEVSEAELQARIFKRFVRGNFMANYEEWYMFDGMDRNTLSLFPNYVTFVTQLKSDKWPLLNLSLQAYLKDRNTSPASSYRWFFTDLSKGERINLELKEASLEQLLKTGIKRASGQDDDEQLNLNDLIVTKGDYLFSVLRARYGDQSFNGFLNDFLSGHKHRSFKLEDLDKAIQERFGGSILPEISDWYATNQLAGYLIKDLQTYKVRLDEYTKFQVRFKIANPEACDGLVTINIDLDNPNERGRRSGDKVQPDFTRKIYLPAQSAKEVGFIFNSEPTRMNIYTHISENLPNNLIYEFGTFNSVKDVLIFDTIKESPLFKQLSSEGEIIVDNEDNGFGFTQDLQISYLKSLIDKNKKPGYKYEGIRFWSPPTQWKSVLRSGFYGKYVRSAMYTKTGAGDRTASWEASLDHPGLFDVYCHIEKININRRRRRETRKSDYHFQVYHEGGMDEVYRSDNDLQNGWNYLGSYYVTPSTAKVVLSNKSAGTMIFADAIKWVENK